MATMIFNERQCGGIEASLQYWWRSADFSPQQCPKTAGSAIYPITLDDRTLLRTEVRAPLLRAAFLGPAFGFEEPAGGAWGARFGLRLFGFGGRGLRRSRRFGPG